MTERETLERRLIDAALDLAEATNTMALCIPVPGTTPPLFVALGEREHIRMFLDLKSPAERDLA